MEEGNNFPKILLTFSAKRYLFRDGTRSETDPVRDGNRSQTKTLAKGHETQPNIIPLLFNRPIFHPFYQCCRKLFMYHISRNFRDILVPYIFNSLHRPLRCKVAPTKNGLLVDIG